MTLGIWTSDTLYDNLKVSSAYAHQLLHHWPILWYTLCGPLDDVLVTPSSRPSPSLALHTIPIRQSWTPEAWPACIISLAQSTKSSSSFSRMFGFIGQHWVDDQLLSQSSWCQSCTHLPLQLGPCVPISQGPHTCVFTWEICSSTTTTEYETQFWRSR